MDEIRVESINGIVFQWNRSRGIFGEHNETKEILKYNFHFDKLSAKRSKYMETH